MSESSLRVPSSVRTVLARARTRVHLVGSMSVWGGKGTSSVESVHRDAPGFCQSVVSVVVAVASRRRRQPHPVSAKLAFIIATPASSLAAGRGDGAGPGAGAGSGRGAPP